MTPEEIAKALGASRVVTVPHEVQLALFILKENIEAVRTPQDEEFYSILISSVDKVLTWAATLDFEGSQQLGKKQDV